MRKTGIGARLEEVRGNATQEAITAELGLGPSTWGRYEREDRLPDTEFLLLLWEKRGINAHWLLTGEGRQQPHGGEVGEEPGSYDSGRFVEVPLYKGVAARAGGGSLVEAHAEEHVEMRAFSAEWIRRELRANPGDLALMHVEGDSMDDGQNGLRPGDVMMVNKADTTATKDGIYVLRIDDALIVKRLQRLPNEKLKVISDNARYGAFEVDLKGRSGSVKIIGRVVYAWGGRRF